MAQPGDISSLENISKEVDNSQVNVLIFNHCMKAQAFLLDKLRKQAERQKEICKFIGSSNLKLETEIMFAEQEINSLNIATETIKFANIELSKEYMLSKERKAEILERTTVGKKKYDNLWLMSKKRYEKIPIVQKIIEFKNKNQTVQGKISAFINDSKQIANEIKIKKNGLEATDRARIIELAEFFVRERTKMLLKIDENSTKINEALNNVKVLQEDESKINVSNDQPLPAVGNKILETIKNSALKNNYEPNSTKDPEKDTLVLPKLQLQNNDLDLLSVKLDQINKVDLQKTTSTKRSMSSTFSDLEDKPQKIYKTEKSDNENYISTYFDISLDFGSSNNGDKKLCKNYSAKKLIHILDDVKLDKNETYKIIKNLEVTQYQPTSFITSKNASQHETKCNTKDEINTTTSIKESKGVEIEEIITNTSKEDVINPPSQFFDISQSCQEKKRVSNNIEVEIEIPTLVENIDNSKGTAINESQDIMLNNSTTSIESYTAIKDNILKNRNLVLSPEFIYSKCAPIPKEHNKGKITSKFFESENEVAPSQDMNENEYNKNVQDHIIKNDENKSNLHQNKFCNVDEKYVAASSPKEKTKVLEPVTGLLFDHGHQGIPDSLNLSISTTGFEDVEDYPHCIDSSVLLSPKADIPSVQNSHTNEVLSGEVPNFLARFQKVGLSIFGNNSSSETKPDSGAQSQKGGFNFDFGNKEKKDRGGFFSMFH